MIIVHTDKESRDIILKILDKLKQVVIADESLLTHFEWLGLLIGENESGRTAVETIYKYTHESSKIEFDENDVDVMISRILKSQRELVYMSFGLHGVMN